MADTTTNRASFVVLALTLGVSIALVFGFLGRLHPAFDSFSHFRLHLAAMLGVLALALFALRHRVHAFAALLLAAGCFAVTLVPFRMAHDYAVAPDDQPVYKLVQFNLSRSNPEPKAVLSMIARERPDILTLNEVSENWRAELDTIATAYPYRLDCTKGDFGTTILSRRPMSGGHNSYCSPDANFAFAEIDLHGRFLDVMAIHLPTPWPFGQATGISNIAPLLEMSGQTAIAAGDFKAAPWSAAARRFAALGGFRDIAYVGATWIGSHVLPPALNFLGLPIDTVMTKGDVIVHSAKAIENAGSDHLPVVIEFSLAPEKQEGRPTQTVQLY